MPFDKRVGRLVEEWRSAGRCETGKPVTWPKPGSEGRWKVEASVLGPTPHRPGGPPIWVAGAVKASRERVGKFFDGWFPNSPLAKDHAPEWAEVVAAAKAAGRDPSKLTAAMYCTLSIDDNVQARRRQAQRLL